MKTPIEERMGLALQAGNLRANIQGLCEEFMDDNTPDDDHEDYDSLHEGCWKIVDNVLKEVRRRWAEPRLPDNY